jgi:putative Ca2+/H+ antiporter (TMEM165/GDT1 family)
MRWPGGWACWSRTGCNRRSCAGSSHAASRRSRYGRSSPTLAFFVAEIGDKTQVATVLLAAKYQPLWQVVAGTTIGMLLANVPVVLLGSRYASRLPLKAARHVAAAVFGLLAAWIAWKGLG